tara:strand:- start:1958 stop:2254 length:297 start_codon:yes stop_codon:yes gene_type:complete
MGFSRYTFTSKIIGQSTLATSNVSTRIFNGIQNGSIPFTSKILKENQRLDHIAADAYGSSDMWWVIAAASGIGWGLQCPAGTILKIPKNASQILQYLK